MYRLLARHRGPIRAVTTRRLSSFPSAPAPPKLPPAEQAEFERLRRAASLAPALQSPAPESGAQQDKPVAVAVPAGVFRGAPPEFTGDTNPRTGEVGGPKNEPLRWGGDGDWSYNGRVTDF